MDHDTKKEMGLHYMYVSFHLYLLCILHVLYTLSVQCVSVSKSFSNLRYDGEFWMEFFKDFCREFEVQTLVLSSFLEVIKGDS